MTTNHPQHNGGKYVVTTINKAIEAAKQSDIASIASLFGCKCTLATGLDIQLLSSTELANQLLQSADPRGWKTLLLLPASYDTPWRAACTIVQESLRSNNAWDSGGLVEIQSFLRQTFSSWWKQERLSRDTKPRNDGKSFLLDVSPRDLVLNLSDLVLKPLLDIGNNLDCDTNRRWFASLDLIVTIVSLSRELEGENLTSFHSSVANELLDKVFRSNIRHDCLLPWLSLALDLKSVLRTDDWDSLQTKLEASLERVPCKVPLSDLPGIGRSIVFFLPNIDNHEEEVDKRWMRLLSKVLAAASLDIPTYSTVETTIREHFSSFSTYNLQRWWKSLSDVNCEPWIAANMHLIFFYASQQSGSQLISSLLAQAVGQNGVEYLDLPHKCWESLVRLQISWQYQFSKGDSRHEYLEMPQRLGSFYYQGEGTFKNIDGALERHLSTAITCQSLFWGDKAIQKKSHRLHAAQQGQLWVDSANYVLKKAGKSSAGATLSAKLDIAMAVLVVVTVYCEIPESRSSLVRTFVHRMIDDPKEASLHCTALKIIIQTFSRNDVKHSMRVDDFNQLAGIFAQRLDTSVCFDLATALSPIPSIRPQMLSTARKLLNIPVVWWYTESTRVAQEGNEGIQCALHLFSCLIDYRDTEGLDARNTISDIIVLSKPVLPLSTRSWFFKSLAQNVNRSQYSADTVRCLYRVCLVRMLHFFDEKDDAVVFEPSRAFASWGTTLPRSSQQECLYGLLHLTLTIFGHTRENTENAMSRQVFRDFATEILSSSNSLDSSCTMYHNRFLDWGSLKDCSTSSKVTLVCLLTIYQACVCPSQERKTPSNKITKESKEANQLKIWRSELVDDERTHYQHSSNLPKWLVDSHDEETRPYHVVNHDFALVMRSLCNLFLDFLMSPLFASLSGALPQNEIAVAFSFLLKNNGDYAESRDAILVGALVEESMRPETVSMFLVLSGPLVQKSIQEKRPLEEVDCVLNAIRNCCFFSARQLAHLGGNVATLLDIVENVVVLYRCVGNQENTIKLIAHLDEKIIGNGNKSFADGYFGKINTSEDVDEVVRLSRCSILKLLSVGFKRLKGEDLIMKSAFSNKEAAGLLAMFSRELRQGLEGLSGGVSDEMYALFLDCIECCSSFSSNLDANQEMATDDQVDFSSGRRGSATLFDILCSFPVRNRCLFKRTLDLAMHQLPALTYEETGKSSDQNKTLLASLDLTLVVLRQCLVLLEKLRTSDSSLSWATIAGPEHVPVDVDEENGEADNLDVDSQIHFPDIPSVIDVVRLTGTNEQGGQIVLRLPTKKHLHWAFDAAIMSMERALHHSLEIIRCSKDKNQISHVRTGSKLNTSREAVAIVVVLLKPNADNGSCIASILPKSSKEKICSLLLKIFVALQKACSILLEHLEKRLFSKSAISEALTMLLTWFRSSTSNSNNDIISLARRWLDARNGTSKANELLSRLAPRILLKVDVLATTLQRLCDKVQEMHLEEANRIGTLDDILLSGDGEEAITISQLVSHLVTKTEIGGLSFFERESVTPRKSMKRKRSARRSRNKIVDQWLHLDHELDDSGDDAYVDLEDFLVDG